MITVPVRQHCVLCVCVYRMVHVWCNVVCLRCVCAGTTWTQADYTTFAYTVTDPDGGVSAEYTVTVSVYPEHNAPVPQSLTITESATNQDKIYAEKGFNKISLSGNVTEIFPNWPSTVDVNAYPQRAHLKEATITTLPTYGALYRDAAKTDQITSGSPKVRPRVLGWCGVWCGMRDVCDAWCVMCVMRGV